MWFNLIIVVFINIFCAIHVHGGACLIPLPALYSASERPRLDGRIVGGHKINISDAPHQISLQTSGHICGGSIISSKWILTAAHCTAGKTANRLKVRFGTSEAARGGEIHRISKIVQHEKFNYSNVDYDYSLLELAEPIEFNENQKPVKLPDTKDEFMDGDLCFVTGWGNTQSADESRDWLRQAEVPIFNQELCSKKYEDYGGITERMICAGYLEGGKDACQGDSGGPLVNESGVLVGIVSWGYGCAKPDYPGVYSKVSYVRDWIKENSGV